jgi:DNA-binding IclR family transcriptional regulator
MAILPICQIIVVDAPKSRYTIAMIDQIDRKLIDMLQGNARLSNAEMAEAVGLTVSSVHERVKKLESSHESAPEQGD